MEFYDSSELISNPHNIFSNSTRRLLSGFEKDRVNPGYRQSIPIFSDIPDKDLCAWRGVLLQLGQSGRGTNL
jgi:hypothetical protein